jgi:hypothetical protein
MPRKPVPRKPVDVRLLKLQLESELAAALAAIAGAGQAIRAIHAAADKAGITLNPDPDIQCGRCGENIAAPRKAKR